MKYDLKRPLLEFDGRPINDGTKDLMMNAQLASMLGNSPSDNHDNTVRMYEWAKTLHSGEILDLTSVDQKSFKEFIGSSKYPKTIIGQILSEMDDQEKKKK